MTNNECNRNMVEDQRMEDGFREAELTISGSPECAFKSFCAEAEIEDFI